MTDIQFRSDFDVELVQSFGSDEMICRAARVSTLGAASIDTDESEGLIRYLMRNRHGTPFEHNGMTFRNYDPIYLEREFKRHRIGFSYSEESARYRELEPVFYMPERNRPLVQVGKPGEYEFITGTDEQYYDVVDYTREAYSYAWHNYQHMLSQGVAREVARIVLPVGIYTTTYVTCNARSLMSFLSLRTKVEGTMFPSYPQAEMHTLASQMETIFAERFPITYAAFNEFGRVSP